MKAQLLGVVAVVLLLALVLSSCSMTAQDVAGDETAKCVVQVLPSGQIVVGGKSTLPNGTCLRSQLFVDEKPQPWWPTIACASVQDGSWQIIVPLRDGGVPAHLDPTHQYELCAWKRGDPTIQSAFSLNLTGVTVANR